MNIAARAVLRRVFVSCQVMFLPVTIALWGCDGGDRTEEDVARTRVQQNRNTVAGEYVHPDGTIYLNNDGTYRTMNKDGNATSGTYDLVDNRPNSLGAFDYTISFHQTSPQAVEGTATFKDGVITNSYGRFVNPNW